MAKSKVHIVRENLDQIIHWKKLGITDEQIYRQLGISRSSWYKYIDEHEDISEAIKRGREVFVIELKNELARQAKPHTLETKKQYIRLDTVTGHKIQYTEITTKEVDGNIGAIHLLLKNIDRENWSNDWQSHELKKQELELRRQMAEDKAF